MIEQCPHCSSVLRFSDAHREKLTQALSALSPGRTLKFGCPKCKTPIELDKTGTAVGQAPPAKPANAQPATPIAPPKAPDISWLAQGDHKEEDVVEDVPTAMVLVDDPALQDATAAALRENQYQIVVPEGVNQAIESMRFKNYDVVAFYSKYNGRALADQDFQKFMMKMSMKKRRKIFYMLIGDEFQTLYDLQALSLSANLVVNTAQMDHLSTLIKKGLKSYEELFGPYLSVLKRYGKN